MNDPHTTPETPPDRAPELDLLLACTRWPQTPADREFIDLQCAKPLDWQRFLHLVQHHRLVPLVSHNLHAAVGDDVPPEQRAILDALRELWVANTYRVLSNLAELRRIVQGLQSHNIPVRVLKGIPLAQSVFGDLSLRAAGDLDLLIDEDSILEADRLLRGFGYRGLFHVERFTPRRLAFYRTHWKDLAYDNPTTGFEIDLHWRCFRNSAMPGAALCATAAIETVSFGSFQVTTLPPMETLLYLCVHGTLDGWLYLKSLADVGAQVRTMDPAQLDALAALAASYAILPELSAALILVRRYFGMEHWSAHLLGKTDPTVEHILRFAGHSLEQGGFLAGRDAIPAGAMMAFEIGLRRNFRYRMELLLRVLFRARMWESIPLPDFLFGIYPLLSPFEWVAFRVRQWLTKPSSSITLSI
jgi:Uncharacterised nucleotidyltransferase